MQGRAAMARKLLSEFVRFNPEVTEVHEEVRITKPSWDLRVPKIPGDPSRGNLAVAHVDDSVAVACGFGVVGDHQNGLS